MKAKMNFAIAHTNHIWNDVEMFPIFAGAITAPPTPTFTQYQEIQSPGLLQPATITNAVPSVPFYSQFKDIGSPKWQKVGCGITSLAMIVDYYKPDTVSVNTLLTRGIAAGAYEQNVGWIYQGLIQLSRKYGLDGTYHDLSKLDPATALAQFKGYLNGGPVILSVHYKFDPKSTIPHLVVINGIANDIVYYNDPAAKTGEKQISVADFLKGWKKKVIVIRPAKDSGAVAFAGT